MCVSVNGLSRRLMAAQRVRFVAQHAWAIRQGENRVNGLVAGDTVKYGVKRDATATR